jgi:hypothetical protein
MITSYIIEVIWSNSFKIENSQARPIIRVVKFSFSGCNLYDVHLQHTDKSVKRIPAEIEHSVDLEACFWLPRAFPSMFDVKQSN